MAIYTTTGKWALRKLTGNSLIDDIDAGFDALAEDIDPKLTPWSAGLWADRPAATKAGQRYFATDLGMEVVADGANWQLVSNVGIGDFVETLRTTDPPGGFLLLANGRTIARASVSDAYSTIIGGTSTNITLPDLRGRGTVAPSNMSGPNQTGNTRVQASAGDVLGEAQHALTDLESGVNRNGTTGNDSPDHTHSLPGVPAVNTLWGIGNDGAKAPAYVGTGISNATGGASARHTHPLSQRNADQAHNTVHPVVAVNKLIRIR